MAHPRESDADREWREKEEARFVGYTEKEARFQLHQGIAERARQNAEQNAERETMMGPEERLTGGAEKMFDQHFHVPGANYTAFGERLIEELDIDGVLTWPQVQAAMKQKLQDTANFLLNADPILAMQQEILKSTMKEEFINDKMVFPLIARALTKAIKVKEKWYVYARIIDDQLLNFDNYLEDPCNIIGKKANNQAIYKHPRYEIKNPSAPKPKPGDIILVKRPLNGAVGGPDFEYVRILKEIIPITKPSTVKKAGERVAASEHGQPVLACGKPSAISNRKERGQKLKVSDFWRKAGRSGNGVGTASSVISYGNKISTEQAAESLKPEVKYFLYQLNQKALLQFGSANTPKLSLTGGRRDAKGQARAVYKNWKDKIVTLINDQGKKDAVTLLPPVGGKIIPKNHDNWKLVHALTKNGLTETYGSKRAEKLHEIHSSYNEEVALEKATQYWKTNPGKEGHQSGAALDFGWRGKTDNENLRAYNAVKAAAEASCCLVRVEKDHFHIETTAKDFKIVIDPALISLLQSGKGPPWIRRAGRELDEFEPKRWSTAAEHTNDGKFRSDERKKKKKDNGPIPPPTVVGSQQPLFTPAQPLFTPDPQPYWRTPRGD